MTGNAIEAARAAVTALAVEKDYSVASADEAISANEALGMIKRLAKDLEAARKIELAPLHEQAITINAKYTDPRDLLIEAETTIKNALLSFRNTEQKRIGQARLFESEAAVIERAKLEAEARKTREKADAEAAKLLAKGETEKAGAVVAAAELKASAKESVAAMVAAPVRPAEPTKLAGASFRKVWKAKVIDMREFLASLTGSPYPIEEFVTVNPAPLNRLASTLQANMEKVLPGSIAWEEETMGARAKP